VLGATNMFNEVFDIEADKLNKPWRPLVSGKTSRKLSLYLSLLLFGLALVWSYYLNVALFFLTIIGVSLGIAYSLPKIRFKDNFFSSMLTLGIGYGFLIPICPWFLFSENDVLTGLLITLISFTWFFGTTNFKDFTDVVGDKIQGTRTLPITSGIRKTIKLMILLMAVIPSMILALYIYWNLFPSLCSLAFISFIATFLLLRKINSNYSPELAYAGYKITYLLYPSIFFFLTVGFWLGG